MQTTQPVFRDLVASLPLPLRARVDPVVDHYHGTAVVDPYRWMENDQESLAAFVGDQDKYARAVLAAIPGRDDLHAALASADRSVTRVLVDGIGADDKIFLRRSSGDDESMRLFVRDTSKGTERELLLDPTGKRESTDDTLDFVVPSPDGRYVAIGVSSNGSEDSVILVIGTDSDSVVSERITRAQYAAVSWRADSRSFYYWRRAEPQPGQTRAQWFENSHSYLHRLGDDPTNAAPLLGPSTPALAIKSSEFSFIESSAGSRWLVGLSTPGGTGPLRVFVAEASDTNPAWRDVAGYEAGVVKTVAHGDYCYLLTHKGAPRYKVTKTSAVDGTVESAVSFLPEGDGVLEDIAAARDGLYVLSRGDDGSRIERIDWDGKSRTAVPFPVRGAVRSLLTRPDEDGVVFSLSSWLALPRWYRFRSTTGLVDMVPPSQEASTDNLEVRHELARSADGTMVPITVLARRGMARDGTAPAWLHGYAAYGLSTQARFDPKMLVWVETGGVLAYCHGRGGGERGEEWHRGGMKDKKENGVSDFVACAEHLISRKWTQSSRLVAYGRSAGGPLVGGVLTRRPELFAAVLLVAPVLNLVRFENSEGGAANVPEFGTVTIANEFYSLYASDPFHRTRPGIRYPSVMIASGANDIRVPLWQPAKMTARLQSVGDARNPMILRVAQDAGHGLIASREQAISELTDLMSFALASARVSITQKLRTLRPSSSGGPAGTP